MRNSLVDVVAAALRVLGAQGLEGCSMRRVAAELGVQPSALYHHVPDKQTLLALMADDIVAGVGARARRRATENRAVPGAASSRPAGTGSAVTRPMAVGPVGSDSAEVNRRVARCMCEARTRNLTSVRASRSMSGWDGPVASRSLAVRPRCLGCARGCRYPPLPSSTLDNAAAVIAADARAGLFGPVRLARPSACLGEISGGRINGGASPPFVRVKAEDSSLKNIRL